MGYAVAKHLASLGANISLADINSETLRAAYDTLPTDRHPGQDHSYMVVDVTSTEDVDDWTLMILAKYRRLDGAVNMAGIICKAKNVEYVEDEEWARTMDVNAGGVFRCLRAEVRAMKQAAEQGGRVASGSIVSVQWLTDSLSYKAVSGCYCGTHGALLANGWIEL
jgi:NAD(P)-dependent dehydrogenase (short-subunit alcohol dehydrogenase family)